MPIAKAISARSEASSPASERIYLKVSKKNFRTTKWSFKEINDKIQKAQKELAALGRSANDSNIALIQNEGLKKRKELSRQVALLKRELRDVKREGREKVESLGKLLRSLNTLLVPFIIFCIGLYINTRKKKIA